MRKGSLTISLLPQRLFCSPCTHHQTQWSKITTQCWTIVLVMQLQIRTTLGLLSSISHQKVTKLFIKIDHWEILLLVMVTWWLVHMVMVVPCLPVVLSVVVMVVPKMRISAPLVQTLEGLILLSRVTADNDPHSEVLSSDNFIIPGGGYPALHVSENSGFVFT